MRWIILLCLAVTAFGCAANGGESVPDVKNTQLTALPEDSRWKLVDSDIAELNTEAGRQVRLQVAGGSLRGYSGCNQFFAGYAMDAAGRITMQPVAQSKRACAEAARNAAEHALMAALRELSTASMRGEQLVLSTTDGKSLVFEVDPVVAE